MSVIAKMYARQMPRLFPQLQQVDLECVCDDRLFTCNEPVPGRVAENQTFTQATPSGDCRFQLSVDEKIGKDEEFYVIFQTVKECPAYPGAIAVSQTRCMSVTDFGGTSKQVDVSTTGRPYDYEKRQSAPDVHPRQTWFFTLRMMIDNPSASIQFKPGPDGETYWVGIYRAREFDLHEALADAHS